jgi:putative heme-binding domain-containing protein
MDIRGFVRIVSGLALTFGAVLIVLAARAGAQAPQRDGVYSPADVQYGYKIYGRQCIGCHGAEGESVPGINLRLGQFKRSTNDNELRGAIANGVQGTAMPPFKFDPAELTGLVAYIRNMRDFDAKSVRVGDAVQGRVVYENNSCATCHRINGLGPRLAPDLSDIGAQRTADALEQSLLDPASALLPVNRMVHAVTKTGQEITGRRMNEDTYSVQLLDKQEKLILLSKADLREYTIVTTPAMSSYRGKLSQQNVADLVAYLLSLKGVK